MIATTTVLSGRTGIRIKDDHKELEAVFKKLESAEPGDIPSLLKQVARLLIPHSKAEEQIVYPAIKRLVPTEGSDVDDGLAEHQHVEETLKELLAADRRPLAWTDSSPR